MKEFTLFRMGTHAILIQWDVVPSTTVLHGILAVKKNLQEIFPFEIVHTYTELLLKSNIPITDYDHIATEIKACIAKTTFTTSQPYMKHYIPVCYDGQFGTDLILVADTLKLSVAEVIRLHKATQYTVHFIGFLPGFLYLEGLDNSLHISRKAKPALSVPKGSVAIGGTQTGIYPQTSPGGWYVIGHCPLSFFDVSSNPICPFQAGDRLEFFEVDSTTHKDISKHIQEGTYTHKKELCYG